MDLIFLKVIEELFSRHGAVAALLIIFNGVTLWIYTAERRDRRTAFKLLNEHIETINKVIVDQVRVSESHNSAIELLTEKLNYWFNSSK